MQHVVAALAPRGSVPGRRSPTERAALALLSLLVAAVLSSWGGSRLSLATRLAELILCVLAWEAAVAAVAGLARRGFGAQRFASTPWPLLGAVVLASLPATGAMMLIFGLVGETFASPARVYGQSLLIGLVLALARRGLGTAAKRPSEVPAPSTAPHEAPPPSAAARTDTAAAFVARHAPKLTGRALVALRAEDHYLRVHAEGGTALILMRLRDAVAELGPDAGWRPHRSYWLARDAAGRAERVGARWRLVLAGGLVVPVSRANVSAMRRAGYRGDR